MDKKYIPMKSKDIFPPQRPYSNDELSPQKRKRGLTYTKQERRLLLELIKNHREIVDNKKTDGATLALKREAWDHITSEFRAIASGDRTVESLKTCYENMKRRRNLKKKLLENQRLADGGVSDLSTAGHSDADDSDVPMDFFFDSVKTPPESDIDDSIGVEVTLEELTPNPGDEITNERKASLCCGRKKAEKQDVFACAVDNARYEREENRKFMALKRQHEVELHKLRKEQEELKVKILRLEYEWKKVEFDREFARMRDVEVKSEDS